VIYPGSTPVGNATLVVANMLTCNKHSHILDYVKHRCVSCTAFNACLGLSTCVGSVHGRCAAEILAALPTQPFACQRYRPSCTVLSLSLSRAAVFSVLLLLLRTAGAFLPGLTR
jgi:hypothetical protein